MNQHQSCETKKKIRQKTWKKIEEDNKNNKNYHDKTRKKKQEKKSSKRMKKKNLILPSIMQLLFVNKKKLFDLPYIRTILNIRIEWFLKITIQIIFFGYSDTYLPIT